VRASAPVAPPRSATKSAGVDREVVIGIGSSTGGVEALFAILSTLPTDCPPVLVVQHMPAAFTASLATRLDRDCAVHVVEATHGTPIEPGTVYIAPGGERHMDLAYGVRGRIRLREGDPVSGHRPSVDVLFNSLVSLGSAAVGVILTGMGADGTSGLLAMRQAGAATLGQSRETCVVYGMPRAAFEAGAVEREVGLSGMAEAILGKCRKNS
jgi:two-component system chemotaxis response regulator CheB